MPLVPLKDTALPDLPAVLQGPPRAAQFAHPGRRRPLHLPAEYAAPFTAGRRAELPIDMYIGNGTPKATPSTHDLVRVFGPPLDYRAVASSAAMATIHTECHTGNERCRKRSPAR
jgi:hypothetical protein